jgi:hypothetical protein
MFIFVNSRISPASPAPEDAKCPKHRPNDQRGRLGDNAGIVSDFFKLGGKEVVHKRGIVRPGDVGKRG